MVFEARVAQAKLISSKDELVTKQNKRAKKNGIFTTSPLHTGK